MMVNKDIIRGHKGPSMIEGPLIYVGPMEQQPCVICGWLSAFLDDDGVCLNHIKSEK